MVVAEADGHEHQAVSNALLRGRRGQVTATNQGFPFPYTVSFVDGDPFSFAEHELELDPAGSLPSSDAAKVAETEAVSPAHYTSHPSGIECIEVTRHMNFPLGNAIKYIWRAGLKDTNPVPDLEKARRYIEIQIEIERTRETK
ncbi:DUF3310 domain-containing protein [Streptomyces uncialis]|uniref:DUF3310 domain-containing protein n=1 Tax=Streptomyces uncialis TaxID=1048205 RepID=UPI000A71C247|nr:DUF3310 domain-containing protein [Streptomyces uncialis]